MKNLPATVAARSGSCAIQLRTFNRIQMVPNKTVWGFYYFGRLEPNADTVSLAVHVSDVALVNDSRQSGPRRSDPYGREEQVHPWCEATIGDYLDASGIPNVVPQRTFEFECYSSKLEEWDQRKPANDDEIEQYLRVHCFWAWRFGEKSWACGPSDLIRLHTSLENIERLASLGEAEDWAISRSTDSGLVLIPTPRLLRDCRKALALSGTPGSQNGGASAETGRGAPVFISEERLAQLRTASGRFDLRKLVALCEEANQCFRAGNLHAVAMITRAIMDHVPPIFGKKTFAEVANNYSGPRSFKECVANLENVARKIGDMHLHTVARETECLPTQTQVDFSRELDVLLGEIVRLSMPRTS